MVGESAQRWVQLACRQQPDGVSEYRFKFVPHTAQFQLVRWDGSNEVQLTSWQISPAVHRGTERNRLDFECRGATISGRVNGVTVALVTDSTYSTGVSWIGAGSYTDVSLTAEARFENLLVTQPPPSDLASAAS
jgi:hypothetical protein